MLAVFLAAVLFGAGAACAQTQYVYPSGSYSNTTYGASPTYQYAYPAVPATTYPNQQYPAVNVANPSASYQTSQYQSPQYQPVQIPPSQPAPAYQAAPQYPADPAVTSSSGVSQLPSYSYNQQSDPAYQSPYQPGAAKSAPNSSASDSNMRTGPTPYMGLETRSGIDVSGQLAYYQYSEPGLGVTETSDTPLLGLDVAGTYAFGSGFFARIEGRYGFTDIDYSGSGEISDRFVDTWEWRGLVGKDFVFPKYSLSPYAGLGFRTLYNDNRGTTSTGAVGYRRYNELTYLPIGIEPRTHIDTNSRLSAMLEFDPVLSGQQKSDLGDDGLGDPAIKNSQSSGYGLRGNIMYEMHNWSFGPYFNYWNIGASNSVVFESPHGTACGGSGPTLCVGQEPANHTIEAGLQFGYHFF